MRESTVVTRSSGVLVVVALALGGVCWGAKGETFGEIQKFVCKRCQDAIVLRQSANPKAAVVVVPSLQGRVMTSTLGGDAGASMGYIHKANVESGKVDKHFANYGGEDRFWLGPEGGQFSLFFGPNVPYKLEHWFTPPAVNEGVLPVVERGEDWVRMVRYMALKNRSGTEFRVLTERTVALLGSASVTSKLGVEPGAGAAFVAFDTDNRITNAANEPMTRDKGLLSIWILGMFNPSPKTYVLAPYKTEDQGGSGVVVNDTYFGKVPADRLRDGGGYLAFTADGNHRSKIGFSPGRAKEVIGSFDFDRNLLTIVKFTLPEGETQYVNSLWEDQKEPYGGDVSNSYNDGPTEPGKPSLGGFYELESSSPAAALEPGQTMIHHHTTFHFQGTFEDMNILSKKVLGIDLESVKKLVGLG